MAEVLVRHGSLEPFAIGAGAQLVARGEQPFGTSIAHVAGESIECDDASLDYVIAHTETLSDGCESRVFAEWRRALKNGARLALLIDPSRIDPVSFERVLAHEAGIFVDERREDGDCVLLLARRDFERSMRRHFAGVLAEVGWAGRPEGWKDELRFDLASLLLQVGEGRLAAEFYRAVLASDPDSVDARVGLALSLALLEGFDEAKQILSEVLEVDPNHGMAASWLRRVHERARPEPVDPNVLEPALRRPRG
ncbi:MAG: tetratricopeptide repeat protein [Planctomycetes bacterium]|nr:tetratricopeptide repeat protein [Planctomycetota bacterium]MCB9917802.1 tetratricopeptide repeat protein [Planctomycetota bacterium]